MPIDHASIRRFLEHYQGTAVGPTPTLPTLATNDDDDAPSESIDRTVEHPEAEWRPISVPEAPANAGEYPQRFIDGSHMAQPVLCVRAPRGWPIPLLLSEVGAVSLRLEGRGFRREFVAVERVLSFVADPFPWEEVEAFAAALLNSPELQLRVLPANSPETHHDPFDYEVMRMQARSRAQREMAVLERLALAVDRSVPVLVDGPLNRVTGVPDPQSPLLIGVAKTHSTNYLHADGSRALLEMRPGQRSPVFRYEGLRGDFGGLPVASWYVKLAGGPQLAPNWGYVRVEVPWGQFTQQFKGDFQFINRLSRWLMDARCRSSSYARMPVSLDPIVRAEEALKPLFTSLPVLVNRLYRTAGLFRSNET